MQSPANEILINVTLTENPDQTYTWSYQSEYEGFDSKTGKVTLQDDGLTHITYALLGENYNFVYVNLDADVCATRQIHNVAIDTVKNRITLTDANAKGRTGQKPFSLRLIARPKGDVDQAIISPDPEVENNPPNNLPQPQP